MSTHYVHERDIDLHGQKIRARVIIEQPSESRKSVAGFPFSLIEMFLNAMFNAIERSIDQALPRPEGSRQKQKRRTSNRLAQGAREEDPAEWF